jgi:predicted nucleic acid-binding protein
MRVVVDTNVFVGAALKNKSLPALAVHIASDRAELVTIAERVMACRDPTDDKFLELAVNGRADVIVTGDADLLVLNPFRDVPIVAPVAFVQGASRSSGLPSVKPP